MMNNPRFQSHSSHQEYSLQEMKLRSAVFSKNLRQRRTVRHFSTREVPREIILNCILAATSAPSGANMQPWHFTVVSDPVIKAELRKAAEREERAFYNKRASKEWLEALAPLGVDEHKPFLETAPYIIAIFAQTYGLGLDGTKVKHYYVNESVGIATGFLIAAIHQAGLVSLTHTPSPMGFLRKILKRPPNERAYLLLVVGYPAGDVVVPKITRKPLSQVSTFL